jgi:cytidyltransferase-like protein
MNLNKILIFGVFDGIHEGHLSFIREAKEQGDQLVAVVARDNVVQDLKGRLPIHNEVERVKSLLEVHDIDLVFLGDSKIETYNVLKEVKPNIIFLGYDQQALFESLTQAIKNETLPQMKIVRGKPHKPDSLHSSILNKE